MVFDGGYVSDVVISDVTIDCVRHDWFWWGTAIPSISTSRGAAKSIPRSNGKTSPPPVPSAISSSRTSSPRGKGSSLINGHPMSWLDGVTLENIKLFLSDDPSAPIQKVEHAMKFRWARNLKIRGLEVVWEKPESERWQSALYFEDVKDLELAEFSGRQGLLEAADSAVCLNQVEDARLFRNKAASGTEVFFEVKGRAQPRHPDSRQRPAGGPRSLCGWRPRSSRKR